MSTTDTMLPLVSAPWLNISGTPLSIAASPGLRAEVIHSLAPAYPGTLSPEMRELLGFCSGLSGTALGSIDFTGCLYPPETLNVYQPCLTLAIDDVGRRWIAETSKERGLPGPVWCVFPNPAVAVLVSDDLAAFIETLRSSAVQQGQTLSWLQGLLAQAHVVWSRRRALALRSFDSCSSDGAIRAWLAGLPFDAYVYDVRHSTPARGWPYGLAGPSARLYRCGQLPVFAVAGWPAGSRWAPLFDLSGSSTERSHAPRYPRAAQTAVRGPAPIPRLKAARSSPAQTAFMQRSHSHRAVRRRVQSCA
jgi:hypothetical protein